MPQPEETQEQILARQAAEQAPIPEPGPIHIAKTIEEAKKDERTPEPEADVKLLIELSQSDAWQVAKRFINRKKEKLSKMTAEAARGSSFNLQNVGFSYLIYDQVSAALDSVIAYVENAAKMKLIERNFNEGEENDETG